MISHKVQALFNFIDFLKDNKKQYLKKYIPISDEIIALDNKRWELKPTKNYLDKQKYDELQKQIIEKAQPLYENVYTPILNKLKELGVWAGDEIYTSIYNNNMSTIYEVRENFTPDDIAKIKTYKEKYINVRNEIKSGFPRLQMVFSSLDEVLKELFDFFKDTDVNEFDRFETKSIQADNFKDAIEGLIENRGKNVRYSVPQESLFTQTGLPIQNIVTPSNTKSTIMAEVFISYSWDSDNHKEEVLAFADLLRQRGYHTDLDRTISQKQTATDFTRMMHEAMQNHPKIIVVLSPGYKEKADKFMGGAGKEYQLLINDIDKNPRKYILVCFGKRNDALTPFGLQGRYIVEVSTSAGITSLDYKLQDKDEVTLSPVATSKPVLTSATPKAFPVAVPLECPIEIVKMNVRQDSSGAAGGVYTSVDYVISFDYKNVSSNTVNRFDFELRMNRHLDGNVLANKQDGKDSLIQESISKPTYKGQTKTTPGFPIKVATYNVRQILGTEIQMKIYTEDGETEKIFIVEDEIKVDPNRLGAYPDKTDLKTAFDIK